MNVVRGVITKGKWKYLSNKSKQYSPPAHLQLEVHCGIWQSPEGVKDQASKLVREVITKGK
jgi:hypothetical protein